MTIFDFQTDLEESNRNAKRPYWNELLPKLYQDLLGYEYVTDLNEQKRGIDWRIYTPNAIHTAEAKQVHDSYNNFCWETESRKGVAGGIPANPEAEHYIYIRPKGYRYDHTDEPGQPGEAFLFTTQSLYLRWMERGKEWLSLAQQRKSGHFPFQANNGSYTTYGINIPNNAIQDLTIAHAEFTF